MKLKFDDVLHPYLCQGRKHCFATLQTFLPWWLSPVLIFVNLSETYCDLQKYLHSRQHVPTKSLTSLYDVLQTAWSHKFFSMTMKIERLLSPVKFQHDVLCRSMISKGGDKPYQSAIPVLPLTVV